LRAKFIINRFSVIILWLFATLFYTDTQSQDLEPRFLSTVPLKTNFAGVVYGYSSGDILLNAQEIENLNAKLNSVVGFYGRSFKLFNKPAKFDIVSTYSFGKLNALVSKVDSTVYKNGFHDPSFRLSMIIIGEEALPIQEFAKRKRKKFKFGAALKIKAPFGQYDNTKVINLGANRWAFQTKIAGSYLVSKKIILELHVDSWFFTKNSSFINGNSLSQKPLLSTQLHAAYIFNPKFWISASIGQVAYGETSINNVEQDNNQENSKYGITASYRLNKLGSLKFVATNSLYTGGGADFNTILFGYSLIWFDKNKLFNKGVK